MSNRTIFLSELYFPEQRSTGKVLTQLAEAIAKSTPTAVLCAQPTYNARGVLGLKRERRNSVDITRCKSTRFDKNHLLGRALNCLSFTASTLLEALVTTNSGDLLVSVTNPPILPVIAAIAAAAKGARYCLIIHDVYPDALVASGLLRPRSVAVTAIRAVLNWTLRRADRIVVIGRDMQALIRARLPLIEHAKVEVIPNWVDVDTHFDADKNYNPVLTGLGIQDKFVIQFCGNIGRTHGITDLLAVAHLLGGNSDIHFLVVGDGGQRRMIEEEKGRGEIPNVSLLPFQPNEIFAAVLAACDIAFVALAKGMRGISVPSRIYNVLASGKPVLAVAEKGSELARIVEEEGIGWVVDPGETNRLVETVLQAKSKPEELRRMGELARRAARKYSFEASLRMYQEVLQVNSRELDECGVVCS